MKKLKLLLFAVSEDRNIGLLLFRVTLGLALMTHGLPKLLEGPPRWEKVGGVMAALGVPGPAVVWGFLAAFAESVGALCLATGAFTTIAAFLIAVTMSIAAFVAHANDPFAKKELAILFLFGAILFLSKGAGRWSMDYAMSRKARQP